jgi:hypothetical protein
MRTKPDLSPEMPPDSRDTPVESRHEGDEPSVFDDTLKFNIEAKFDMCGYSLLTPYPGTINWCEMLQRKQIASLSIEISTINPI